MKANSGLFIVLLILWFGASTYWYVCEIKNDCEKQTAEIVPEKKESKPAPKAVDTVSTTDKDATIVKDTASVINALKAKLKDGYTLSGFSLNSSKNSVSNDFDVFADNLKIYFEGESSCKILITGHTDNTGTPAQNLKVGKKRANFLKSKLIEKGIDKNRILTASKGGVNPVANNETEKGRAQNRRAVITIINN